jgi:hypothetical protein
MFLLATTELGTDSWIQDIMRSTLDSKYWGTLFLVYISEIMCALRLFAGPIAHRLSPLGMLAAAAALTAMGLLWLGNAGPATGVLFAAATLYACGKSFFWPTTLAVVSEQYPRGGALLINAISGVGMIAVGTLGATYIGTIQDQDYNQAVAEQLPEAHASLANTKSGLFSEYEYVDKTKFASLSEENQTELAAVERQTKQHALSKIAYLPAAMFVCYLGLIIYYQSRGGYQPVVLSKSSES